MKIEDINKILIENSLEWGKFHRDCLLSKKVTINNIDDRYIGLLLSIFARYKVLLLTDDQIMARQVSDNVNSWRIKNILLPNSWSQINLEDLKKLDNQLLVFQRKGGIIISSMEEWKNSWSFTYHEKLILDKGGEYGFAELSGKLIENGYQRVSKVADEGEFAVLGDVWQIIVAGSGERIQLFFDNKTLVKIASVEKGESKNKCEIYGKLCRTEDMENSKELLMRKIGCDVIVKYGIDELHVDFGDVKKIYIKPMQVVNGSQIIKWPIVPFSNMFVGVNGFIDILNKGQYKQNIIITNNYKQTQKWVYDSRVDTHSWQLFDGKLAAGGLLVNDKLSLWSDGELYGEVKDIQPKIARDKRIDFKKLSEYKIGDLVVHADHGIAVLKDFVTKEVLGISKDYLLLLYDRGDLLYVPVDQLHKISKYIGSKLVKLSRLGGKLWMKKKRKAKKQVEIIAKELLRLYAKRKLVYRKPYILDSDFLENINNSFEYELTVDQKIALDDINTDLSHSFPMDRLLCGDVGFGKTEIALRAAARAVSNKKQVAFLTPTTILSEQHWATFFKRFTGKNVRVEVLNRLRDEQYQKNILCDLKDGKVDIIIGTHRLLQKDMVFCDLGLLIIDEEQKFGVSAKERLKKIRNEIDILSLSATPIPRTLNMSMGGVRDLSILEVAPCGRQTINTEVLPYSLNTIKEAITREVARGGQIFVVHNRVRTIGRYKDELEQLFDGKIRIGIAHGQMLEKDLAKTMADFAAGKLDVLLATTIVENGLDLPNVNTLIVENSSGLGLSQLYQLRGRVGRSSQKAYAYFLYRSEKLKVKAKQRLMALADAKELGSGLKLAVADMEIRGVGNILGVEQHGNAYAIGLGMFLDMLEEMVARLKNERETIEFSEEGLMIDLPVNCSIPDYYIDDKEKRLVLEQKLAVQSAIKDVDRMADWMQQNYGVMDERVQNLVIMNKIRILAQKLNIVSIVMVKKNVRLAEVRSFLEIDFGREVNIREVNYLMDSNPKWVFEENKARIDVNDVGKSWFEWLYKLLLKNI